jgi:hypothetical protein
MLYRFVVASSIGALAALAGCGKPGPKIAPVTGVVALDGSPLSSGVVSFVSASGYVSSARLAPDGRFRLVSQYGDGIPLGAYRVTVLPEPGDPREMPVRRANVSPTSAIPLKYQYPDRSGISATVVETRNEMSIDLRSKAD